MIPVSNGWKAAQNETLLPEMFVEITYDVTEPGLQEEAVVSANNPEPFSDIAQLTSREDKNGEAYSTLDYGCWGLDGSFTYFDGTPVDPGYVDESYSDNSCEMGATNYPKITLDFERRHTNVIPGIVISWSDVFGGWATDFRVTTRNSQGLVAQKTIRDNTSVVSHVLFDIVDYSQITIEILKWSHPYQRVRCMSIWLGSHTVYTKTDLMGYTHSQTVDLLSAKLPENKIEFKLRNDDGRWNPDVLTGTEKYLLEQQEVSVRYAMDVNGTVEWINGGTFWLSEWETPANGLEANFTARDAIEFMRATYTGIRKGTLYEIAIAAFTEANLTTLSDGSDRYIVDESLKSINTDFSIDDADYSIAEILQMVAHSGCCVFYQDRNGVIHIEPWNKTYSDYRITQDVSYTHPEYTINKPLKSVFVEYGGDGDGVSVEVSSKGEVQTVTNPLILTPDDAMRVGNTATEILKNRKVVSGDFRADLRVDALDNIMVISKYAPNIICVTDMTYSMTSGAFRGNYTGRIVSIPLEATKLYSGEANLGEVW